MKVCCTIGFNLNGVSSVVWSSFSKVQYRREPSHFLHLFLELSLILKNENFPDYFGSYNTVIVH